MGFRAIVGGVGSVGNGVGNGDDNGGAPARVARLIAQSGQLPGKQLLVRVLYRLGCIWFHLSRLL